MATRTRAVVTDTYFALVRQFPLIPIANDKHLEAASAFVNDLLKRELDDGEEAYLDVLSDLIMAYEDKTEDFPRSTPPKRLAALLRNHGLSQSALARETGISQSTLSAVIHGTRRFTWDQAVTLGKRFAMKPAAFLSE